VRGCPSLVGGRPAKPHFELYYGERETKELFSAFKAFCMVDLQLTEETAKIHMAQVRRLMVWLENRPLSQEALREYLSLFNGKSSCTYANVLKSLKVFCRDFLKKPELVESFRFPTQVFKPKAIPSREDLQRFYEALDSFKEKALFLLYASSGLRKMEILSLTWKDVDFEKRMIKPKFHNGETKKVWVSFFNMETARVLKQYLESRKDSNPKLFPMGTSYRERLWFNARAKTALRITPQTLREWFCSEMSSKGVSDSYIDAFCGRIPRSILAKHYLDYSPEKLKEIYDKADLKVLAKDYPGFESQDFKFPKGFLCG
jgi:integrase